VGTVRGWAVVVAVLAAGCAAPAVSLPEADRSQAPSTFAPPSTSTSIPVPPPTEAPPVTAEPPVTTPDTVPDTVPDLPPDASLVLAAMLQTDAALGGPQRYWSARAVPGATVQLLVDAGGDQVGYVWSGGTLVGPVQLSPTTGGQPFAATEVNPAGGVIGVNRLREAVPDVEVQQILAVAVPGQGVLWGVVGFRPDGQPVSGIFANDGTLLGLDT
jgi:hypothetical protein